MFKEIWTPEMALQCSSGWALVSSVNSLCLNFPVYKTGIAILALQMNAGKCWRTPLCPSEIVLLLLSARVAEEQRHWEGERRLYEALRTFQNEGVNSVEFCGYGLAATESRCLHSGFPLLNFHLSPDTVRYYLATTLTWESLSTLGVLQIYEVFSLGNCALLMNTSIAQFKDKLPGFPWIFSPQLLLGIYLREGKGCSVAELMFTRHSVNVSSVFTWTCFPNCSIHSISRSVVPV